jgi:hypothetical protein
MTFKELNAALLEHYDCFQTERFYLDWVDDGGVGVVTSSISDNCDPRLCTYIAKFIKKLYLARGYNLPRNIYVACWIFEVNSL